MKYEEKAPSACPALFNNCLSTDKKEQVSNLWESKWVSEANQTPKKTALPKYEVQGIDDLIDSYPDFDLKDIPQGLEYFGKYVNFLVDNSTSNVPFPYPKFDAETYFQTSNFQSKSF